MEARRPNEQAEGRILGVVTNGIALRVGSRLRKIEQGVAEEHPGHDVPGFIAVLVRFRSGRCKKVTEGHCNEDHDRPIPVAACRKTLLKNAHAIRFFSSVSTASRYSSVVRYGASASINNARSLVIFPSSTRSTQTFSTVSANLTTSGVSSIFPR